MQSTIWEKSQQNKNQDNFTLSEIDDSLIQDLLNKDINSGLNSSTDTGSYTFNKD